MAINEKEVNQQEQEEKEGFKVDTDDLACWALKKIKKLQEEIKDKKELADRQMYQIEQWLNNETKKREESIKFFESALEEYAKKLKAKDPDLKTHSLPFGDLQFRAQQPKWEYEDDELLDSVKDIGLDVVKVKESVDKNELKKLLKDKNKFTVKDGRFVNKETGEVIDGVEVKDKPEKFSVKVT